MQISDIYATGSFFMSYNTSITASLFLGNYSCVVQSSILVTTITPLYVWAEYMFNYYCKVVPYYNESLYTRDVCVVV